MVPPLPPFFPFFLFLFLLFPYNTSLLNTISSNRCNVKPQRNVYFSKAGKLIMVSLDFREPLCKLHRSWSGFMARMREPDEMMEITVSPLLFHFITVLLIMYWNIRYLSNHSSWPISDRITGLNMIILDFILLFRMLHPPPTDVVYHKEDVYKVHVHRHLLGILENILE